MVYRNLGFANFSSLESRGATAHSAKVAQAHMPGEHWTANPIPAIISQIFARSAK